MDSALYERLKIKYGHYSSEQFNALIAKIKIHEAGIKNETWKDIPEFENLYQVSNMGNIRRFARRNTYSLKRNNLVNWRILKCKTDSSGYKRIKLSDKYRCTYYAVHRLVGILFIPNPENKPQINHIDGKKKNNKASNLEWCTPSENAIHAVKTGLNKGHDKTKVIAQLSADGKILNKFDSVSEAVRQTECGYSMIKSCLNGLSKTHKGFCWKYLPKE